MEGLLSDKRKFWPNQPTLRDDMDQEKGNVEGERKV